SVMIDQPSGLAVRAAATPTSTATIRAGSAIAYDDNWADVMASGSSRGPIAPGFDILAPDFSAPGTNILAAYTAAVGYNAISGTSMASPHGAGAAALISGLNPTWSPAQVRSALSLTATSNMLKEDGIAAA